MHSQFKSSSSTSLTQAEQADINGLQQEFLETLHLLEIENEKTAQLQAKKKALTDLIRAREHSRAQSSIPQN